MIGINTRQLHALQSFARAEDANLSAGAYLTVGQQRSGIITVGIAGLPKPKGGEYQPAHWLGYIDREGKVSR